MTTRKNVLPGFNLSLGYTIFYLSLIVLIPLSAAFITTTELSLHEFLAVVSTPRVVASYKLTFGASFIAALINAVFGLLTAWVLVRYTFPGKKIIDALVDLPFALPTAVAGIALTAVYSNNGWIGSWLEPHGIKVAFTPARRGGGLDLYRPAFCGAHRATGAGRSGSGNRRSRRQFRCKPLANFL
jgi:sulfate transport system permease protein